MIHYTQEQRRLASKPITLIDWQRLNTGRWLRYTKGSKGRTRTFIKPPYKR